MAAAAEYNIDLSKALGALGIGGVGPNVPPPQTNPSTVYGPPPQVAPVGAGGPIVTGPAPQIYGPPNPNPVPATAGPAPAGGDPLFDSRLLAGAFGLDPHALPTQLQQAPKAFNDAIASLGITPNQLREVAKRDRIPDAAKKGTKEGEDLADAAIANDQGGASAFAPPTIVPAHWDPTRIPYTAESLAQRAAARQKEAGGIKEAGEIAAEDAASRAGIIQGAVDEAESFRKQQFSKEIDRKQALEEQQKKWQQAQEEANKATIDPDQYWKDGGAARRMMGAIGGAVGGMLQGLQGGENQFLKEVDKNIALNIQSQREALGQKKQKVADAANVLGQMRQRFGDERAADVATHMWYREQTKARLDQQAAEIGTKTARNNANMAIAQLDEANADDQMKLDAMAYVPKQVVGGPGGAADKNRDKIFEFEGKRYEARNTEQAAKLADGASAASEFKRLANQLDVLRNDPETYASLFGLQITDKAAEAANISERMITQLSTMANSGTINAGEYDRYKNQLGDPNALTSRAGMKGKQWAGMIDKHVRDSLRSNAVEEVKTGYKPTATGGVAPTASYTGSSPTKTATPTLVKKAGE